MLTFYSSNIFPVVFLIIITVKAGPSACMRATLQLCFGIEIFSFPLFLGDAYQPIYTGALLSVNYISHQQEHNKKKERNCISVMTKKPDLWIVRGV